MEVSGGNVLENVYKYVCACVCNRVCGSLLDMAGK